MDGYGLLRSWQAPTNWWWLWEDSLQTKEPIEEEEAETNCAEEQGIGRGSSVGTDGEFLDHHWSPLYGNQGTHHSPDWLVRVFPMTHMSHFISDILVIQPTLRMFCYWTFPHPMTHLFSHDIILLLYWHDQPGGQQSLQILLLPEFHFGHQA